MDENTKVQLLKAALNDGDLRDHLHRACGVAQIGGTVIHVVDVDEMLLPLLYTPEDYMRAFEYEVAVLPFLPEEFRLPYQIGAPLEEGVNWKCGWPAVAWSYENGTPLPQHLEKMAEESRGKNPFNARLQQMFDQGENPLEELFGALRGSDSDEPNILDFLAALMSGKIEIETQTIGLGIDNGMLFAVMDDERADITPEALQAALTGEEKPFWFEPLRQSLEHPMTPQWVRDMFAAS